MPLKAILDGCSLARKHLKRVDTFSVDELRFISTVVDNLPWSNGQLFQDIWVLFETQFKRSGYFVEFGACDGIEHSNTYVLEKIHGWTGILAEPGHMWINRLVENRSCHISRKCVYKCSGEKISFNEVEGEGAVYSTIESYTKVDHHASIRETGRRYEVETLSLNDLLAEFDAPREIDYLSIDTEGSELDILSTFDFNKYKVKLISVEHNHTIQRDEIFKFLSWKGYTRKFSKLSDFDDWYVLS